MTAPAAKIISIWWETQQQNVWTFWLAPDECVCREPAFFEGTKLKAVTPSALWQLKLLGNLNLKELKKLQGNECHKSFIKIGRRKDRCPLYKKQRFELHLLATCQRITWWGAMGNANRLHVLLYLNKPQCGIYSCTLRNHFLEQHLSNFVNWRTTYPFQGKKKSESYPCAKVSFTSKQRSRLSTSAYYFHFSLFCLLGRLPRIVCKYGFCPLLFLQKLLGCFQMFCNEITALRTTRTMADTHSLLKLASASHEEGPKNPAGKSSSFTAAITDF